MPWKSMVTDHRDLGKEPYSLFYLPLTLKEKKTQYTVLITYKSSQQDHGLWGEEHFGN